MYVCQKTAFSVPRIAGLFPEVVGIVESDDESEIMNQRIFVYR